jgi:hypothetical protein
MTRSPSTRHKRKRQPPTIPPIIEPPRIHPHHIQPLNHLPLRRQRLRRLRPNIRAPIRERDTRLDLQRIIRPLTIPKRRMRHQLLRVRAQRRIQAELREIRHGDLARGCSCSARCRRFAVIRQRGGEAAGWDAPGCDLGDQFCDCGGGGHAPACAARFLETVYAPCVGEGCADGRSAALRPR